MASENKTLKRGIELYIDGKQVQANMKQVEAEARKLKKEIDGMTVGSKEYFEATKRYQELNRVLREHKNELKGIEVQHQSLFKKAGQLLKDYGIQIMGVVGALANVSMKINSFRKQANEKEDAAANLKALTGLDDENIAWLTQQAEKLSTTMEKSGLRVRKSATEILDAYMLVGSAKPELLKDKEALNAVTIEAMRLAEAAKMELKDSVDAVTISLNQYNAGADQAIRFTNVLAAGSKYGAANVQAQAAAIKNSGVAAASAGLSIEQHVGVIEMLAEKGIKAEEAGTALKGVFLKLQTGADDTNPAIVGLDKALENLAAKGMSAGEILKMFDRRGYNAAKILIDNTEKVKEYTKAVTDTNVAVEQAAINSDTAAAKMAQHRNQINLTGQELAKTLAPIISQTVGWTRKFVLSLPPLIDYLKKYGLSTAALIATLILYNTYTKIATSTTSAWSAVIGFAKTQLTAFKGILAAYRTVLTGSTTAQIEMTAAMKGTNIVTRLAAIAVGLLKAAYYALSLQMAACVRTLKMVKVALAESGIGIVILGIGALVAGIIRHNEKLKEARRLAEEQRQAEKALYKEYDEAAARIKLLRKVAEGHTASLDDRRKAIEELQKLAPDYQASISTEGKLIEKNKEKLDEYLERLKASIILEAYKTKMSELLQKQTEAEEEQQKTSDEYWKIRQQNTLQGYNRNGLFATLSRLFGTEAESNAHKTMEKAENELKEINKEIDATEQRMKETAEKWGFSLVDETANGSNGNDNGDEDDDDGSGNGDAGKETKKEKRIRKELAAIDAEYNKKAADLKQQYIDGEIQTEQEYSSRLQQIELERLRAKMQVAGLEEKQSSDFLQRMMDLEMDVRKRVDEMTKISNKDTVKARLDALQKDFEASKAYLKYAYDNGIIPTEKRYKEYVLALEKNFNIKKKELLEKQANEQIAELKKQEDAELQELKLHLAQRLLTEEEYEETLLEIRRKYAEKRKKIENQSKEATAATAKEEKEVEIAEAEEASKKLEKYAEQLKDIASDVQDAFGDLGEELAEAIFGDDFLEGMKNAGKEFLKQALDIVEKYIMIKQAQIMADQIAEASTFVGIASAILKATAKMAAIKMAFGLAKGAVSSFDIGGFTPDGRWNEPKGVVHSNEFVANRYAVKNPQVLPVLQLIDAAQRSGSISNLSGKEIAAVATGNAPASSPVAYYTNNAQTQPFDLRPLYATLIRLEKVMDRATDAYKEPSPAYCYVNGRGGINEAQELNETINRNASRK